MKPISYSRHRFPPDVIRHAVWLYFRFTLSFRDVEDLMAERGIELSYDTIRCWTQKFGQLFARNLRRSRSRPTARWHLDEMVVKISGQGMYLWRAGLVNLTANTSIRRIYSPRGACLRGQKRCKIKGRPGAPAPSTWPAKLKLTTPPSESAFASTLATDSPHQPIQPAFTR